MHAGIYWARVQTSIVSPGRFQAWESVVGSDVVVFALPILLSTIAIFLVWSPWRRHAPWIRILALSGALALGGAYVAFLFAFNRWGT